MPGRIKTRLGQVHGFLPRGTVGPFFTLNWLKAQRGISKSALNILQPSCCVCRLILSNRAVSAFSSIIYCQFFWIILRVTFILVLFKAVTTANNWFLAYFKGLLCC